MFIILNITIFNSKGSLFYIRKTCCKHGEKLICKLTIVAIAVGRITSHLIFIVIKYSTVKNAP